MRISSRTLFQLQMRELFSRAGLEPRVVFAGIDVDVVKAFVEAGLGIAVLPRLAYDARRDSKLGAVDVLSKPVDIAELRSSIESALAGGGSPG